MKRMVILAMAFVLISGCSRYETRVVPFKLPEASKNMQVVNGTKISALAYVDSGVAEKAFGFDIRGAGLLPVQVAFDNQGKTPFIIDPSHTYLIDKEQNAWPVMEAKLAYERVEKSTEMGKIASGAGKHAFLAGAAGAIVGAAIGIVSGENVGEAMGKGAALGAAAGAVVGGAQAYGTPETYRIMEDFDKKNMKNKPITPGELAHGFIFFPGEAKTAKELRLRLNDPESNKSYNVNLPFFEEKQEN